MTYESAVIVASRVAEGVSFTVTKMSFGRRLDLMRKVRDLARKMEFRQAGSSPEDRMDAVLLESEVNRLYLSWGLRAVSGLTVDAVEATPEILAEIGPEDLFREAVAAVRAQTGLDEAERKN
jgi:hypothetical protein